VRLLYLTDRLSDRGGADNHLAQVINAVHHRGHVVSIGCGRVEGDPRVATGIDRRRLRGLASRVDSTAGLGGLDELAAAADVIHIHNVMNPAALAIGAGSGRAVVTIQDHRFFCPGPGKTLPDGRRCESAMADRTCDACIEDPGYRSSTLELTARRMAAVRSAPKIVLSRYMANELEAAGERDVEVIPPWAEPGVGRRGAGRCFVLAGRLVAHKGVLDGWRAWDEAGRPCPLVVAGEGPLADVMEGAERRGWLRHDSLMRLLDDARALLFPARWQEPFGILGIEALARGAPVIIAESGGTPDWSEAGCIRVPAGDVSAMAAAVRRLADSPETAVELGRSGRRMVAERFTQDSILPMIERVYRRAARG
jgi:glycosyltransferase involved in cell wall biosynthesis